MMRYKKRVVIPVLVLLLGLLPANSAHALEVPPVQQVEIPLRVTTPAYTLDVAGIHVAGYAANDIPGAPVLPFWSTVVELPPAGAWELTYASAGQQVLALTDPLPAVPVPQVALGGPLSPAEIADRVAQATWADRPDPAIYGTDAFYPAQPVQAGPEGWQRGRRLLAVRVFPFQYNPARGELRYYPDLRVKVVVTQQAATSGAITEENLANQENLRPIQSSAALRVYTGQRGMYRLTYDDLAGAGVPLATADPARFAMWHLDESIAIEVLGGEDGSFDPDDFVVFYAEPYQGRYMTQNVYWFGWESQTGERMAVRDVRWRDRTYLPVVSGGGLGAVGALEVAARQIPQLGRSGTSQSKAFSDVPLVTAITRTLHVEYDRSYYSTYKLPQDADHWFDNPLYANQAAPVVTATYALALDTPLTDGNVLVRALLHGGADRGVNPDQSVAIALNGQPVGLFQWQGSHLYHAEAIVPASWLQPSGNQLTLTAALAQLSGLDAYWVSPDWVAVSYPAQAVAQADRLYIEGLPVSAARDQIVAAGFTTGAVRAYDVRDPARPARLLTQPAPADGAVYTLRFYERPLSDASYWLTTEAAYLAPAAIVRDAPSAWRMPDHAADYIAIVHRSLWDAIQPLLAHRTAEGLRVAKVDVQDIYDEFSGGRVDPEAIRSFLAYAYTNWNGAAGSALASGAALTDNPPQYVLLVGDGHYDFKGVSRPDLPNLIPPYLLHIDPFIGETAADNRYASVEGPEDFLPEMAIGRIPAKTPADVAAVVDKILTYETAAVGGEWQSRVVFVADNKDDSAGNFHSMSDQSRLGMLPAGYDDRTIYFRADAHTAPEMKQAIRGAFDAGALYLQWFGHASRQRWGGGLLNMFDLLDPPRLAANTALPFTAHYSCWSGYFINIQGSRTYNNSEVTLGEALLLTPGRGAVADFSPSGLHIGSALVMLNQGVVRAIFDARVERVGLAVEAAKQEVFARSSSAVDLIDTQILFGDPATRLRLPPETQQAATSGVGAPIRSKLRRPVK